LLDLLDALGIAKAVLAGFDWGGRAACAVSALWPERVQGLVTCAGYLIQDIARSAQPASPEQEARFWYQYYFHLERGRNGLDRNRRELCRLLWKLWSPTWAFDDVTYEQTARSLDHPDFVDVVIHAYRHRFGNASGDPRYAAIEAQLAAQPKIAVPTINLHGAVDGVVAIESSKAHHKYFTDRYERRVLSNIGHNPPQEAPDSFADAVLTLCRAE
jgi:pimeloyl-ACP methyl ester carboxylesterase